jgi:hypothetical protein
MVTSSRVARNSQKHICALSKSFDAKQCNRAWPLRMKNWNCIHEPSRPNRAIRRSGHQPRHHVVGPTRSIQQTNAKVEPFESRLAQQIPIAGADTLNVLSIFGVACGVIKRRLGYQGHILGKGHFHMPRLHHDSFYAQHLNVAGFGREKHTYIFFYARERPTVEFFCEGSFIIILKLSNSH